MKPIRMMLAAILACLYGSWGQRGPLEVQWGPLMKGPSLLSSYNQNSASGVQWQGATALNSGTAYATMSTRAINSDSFVRHAFNINTTVASGSAGPCLAVSSIVSGVSFAIGYADGAGRGPGGTLMWEIVRRS